MKQLSLGLALAFATTLPAAAGNVLASDPASISQILQSFGYRAELGKDDGGDPKISSASGGAKFSIFFYGCTDGKNCESLNFSAGFDLVAGSNAALMDEWNRKKRYTKAYLDDDQDPAIDMDINLSNGGVSIDNFRSWLDTWERALGDFKTHINF